MYLTVFHGCIYSREHELPEVKAFKITNSDVKTGIEFSDFLRHDLLTLGSHGYETDYLPLFSIRERY